MTLQPINEGFFRQAIDLNQYSNNVARQIIQSYNDIVIDAAQQLSTISDINSPEAAARLRALLLQIQESLDTWAGDSSDLMTDELAGLALLQSDFIQTELQKIAPGGSAVRSVAISPEFAKAVVTKDPLEFGVAVLSDARFFDDVMAGTGATFSLGAQAGSLVTLPDGRTFGKALRNLSEKSSELFGQQVRTGLLAGTPTQDIIKNLIGKLTFADADDIQKIAKAGGSLTTLANNQIQALVRTAINQVSNEIFQSMFAANSSFIDSYRYVATLDARTSAICRSLDGKIFPVGKGPRPPQHFNCRSITIPIIDWGELPPPPPGTRASAKGQVPADMTYGQWISQPGNEEFKRQAFGSKEKYFDLLAKKHGPDVALQKMVRDHGREITLSELQNRYGKS